MSTGASYWNFQLKVSMRGTVDLASICLSFVSAEYVVSLYINSSFEIKYWMTWGTCEHGCYLLIWFFSSTYGCSFFCKFGFWVLSIGTSCFQAFAHISDELWSEIPHCVLLLVCQSIEWSGLMVYWYVIEWMHWHFVEIMFHWKCDWIGFIAYNIMVNFPRKVFVEHLEWAVAVLK
jgi:hypothetical protein